MPARRLRRTAEVALITAVVLIASAIVLSRPACAAEFSADVVHDGPTIHATGRFYRKGRNSRTELATGRVRTVAIINRNRKRAWFLDPARRTYREMPIPSEPADDGFGSAPAPRSRSASRPRRVGTEVVNGYVCEKSVLQANGWKSTEWFSRELDLVMKSEYVLPDGDTYTHEFSNIRKRKLPDSLFEVPEGYTKLSPAQRPGKATAPGASGSGGDGAHQRRPTPRGRPGHGRR